MGEVNLMDLYPRSSRPIKERGDQITEAHRQVAKQFDENFFDGERLYGYGGYSYHPRFWQPTVKRFRDHYSLPKDASVLDVGCAKGFMLHDFKELMPDITIAGIDVSEYAINTAMESVKPFLQVGNAKDLPFEDDSFDLVISINTVHNLPLEECKQSLREIQRVARKDAFIVVDSWRSDEEKESMQAWNLTAETYMLTSHWEALFAEVGYSKDYYWFIAA
jgi:ubiquinone/menaquinone biosynthesis C-methylase UbiE